MSVAHHHQAACTCSVPKRTCGCMHDLSGSAASPPEPKPAPNSNQHRQHHRAGAKRGALGAHEKMMTLLREVELRRAETRLEKVEVIEGEGADMFEVLRRDWLVRLQPQRQTE